MFKDEPSQLSNLVSEQWHEYQKRLQNCQRQLSEDNVHKLRTGIRRFLALTALLTVFCDHPQLPRLRKRVKKQLRALSLMRDNQVMRNEISLLIAEYPPLEPFLHHLHLRELEQNQTLQITMKHWHTGNPGRKLEKIQRQLQPSLLSSQQIDNHIKQGIASCQQRVRQRLNELLPDNLESFHRLRIAIKNLRYSLEINQQLPTDYPCTPLQSIKSFQEILGEIQNSQVLLEQLTQFFGSELDADLQQHLTNRQQQWIAEFLTHRQRLGELCQPVVVTTQQ